MRCACHGCVATMPGRPQPAREAHVGRFEVKARDGRRASAPVDPPWCRDHTHPSAGDRPEPPHYEPREMWDRYGIEMLITNSYIIWKHDKLRIMHLSTACTTS